MLVLPECVIVALLVVVFSCLSVQVHLPTYKTL